MAGVDYGTVRIGVALTDAERLIASPHATYTRRDEDADAKWFQQLVREEAVVGFVVGLPVHLSGKPSKKSLEARQFGSWLQRITSLPVCYHDERFTSVEAEHILSDAKIRKRKKKSHVDKLAAQLMLAAFLESPNPTAPGALDD